MAMKKMVVLMVIAMAAMLETSRAMSLCNISEDGLMACKPSVTKPDPVDPSAACCSALTGADLECLCSYKDSSMLSLLGIDPDLALGLPAKCSLPTPNC